MFPDFAFSWKGLLIVVGLTLFLPWPGITQHRLVLYQMGQVPQSNLLNPGIMPSMNTYIGLPALNSMRAGVLNSALTIDQLAGSGGGVLTDIDYSSLLPEQKARNRFSLEADVSLFALGLRLGKGVVHVNVAEHFMGNFRYPGQLVRLLNDVQQAGEQGSPGAGSAYDLSELAFRQSQYRSYGLGYTYQLFPNLSVGGRFHFLQGRVDLWTVNRDLTFINSGKNNFGINGRLDILSAGIGDISGQNLLWPDQGNSGYAFDFGAVYRLNDQWEFSASALNLGAIRWKRNLQTQIVAENLFSFSTRDLEAFEDEVNAVFDGLQESETVDGRGYYQTPLPRHFYLGASYYYRPGTFFGAVVHPVFSDGHMDVGFGLSANTRLRKWIGVSAAYSLLQDNLLNLGLGVNLNLGPVQLYAISDNLPAFFSYRDAHNANVQLGINLVFGRRQREELLLEEEPIAEAEPAEGVAEDSVNVKTERALRREEQAVAKKKAREVAATEKTVDKKADKDAQRQERQAQAAAKKQTREVAAAEKAADRARRQQTEEAPIAARPKDRPTAPTPPPAAAADTAVVEEQPAASTKPAPFFTFTLTAKDQATGTLLKGLSLEISRVVGSSRELLFTGSAYSGIFSMPLEREFTHIIIVRKLGYLPDEFLLEAGDAGAQQELRHEFILVEGPAPTTSRHQPGFPPSAGPTAQIPAKPSPAVPDRPLEPAPVAEGTASVNGTPDSPQPALGTYEITDPTSLREGPHHTHPVIMRFNAGDRVEVLEKTDAYWWKVRYRGRVGYVKAALLQ